MNIEAYYSFGRLRNSVQHFTSPNDRDLSKEVIEFIFGIVDPFINECWGLFAIDYNEDHEPYEYFIAGLIGRGIRFLISPGMIKNIKYIDLEYPSGDQIYQSDMENRIRDARARFS